MLKKEETVEVKIMKKLSPEKCRGPDIMQILHAQTGLDNGVAFSSLVSYAPHTRWQLAQKKAF